MNYSHFVGLDVGKNTFDASLMSAVEKELSHKSFDKTLRKEYSPCWLGLTIISFLYLKSCFVPKIWVVTSRNYLFLVLPWDSL